REMVVHNVCTRSKGPGVSTLETLCTHKVLKLMTSAVRRKGWTNNKPLLHQILQHNLPHYIRQHLQNLLLSDWRLYDTVTLHLLGVLLGPRTSSLKLTHVRIFYRDALLQMLLGLHDIQEFILQDPIWTFSRRQLILAGEAISQMTQLRVLKLQYCAHDYLLAAVGDSCHNLLVLDVRGSRSVSDRGIAALITPASAMEGQLLKGGKKQDSGRCLGKAVKSITSKITMALVEPKSLENDNELEEDSIVQLSPCCQTLVCVDLRCTKVSSTGVAWLTSAVSPKARIASIIGS
ncbi:unnamed protein product, partial [Meganyctiphanes norvegica]